MSDSLRRNPAGNFRDLVPWADPYIAALLDKLRRTEESEAVAELPPPLDSDNPDRDSYWPTDWSPRNWPRN